MEFCKDCRKNPIDISRSKRCCSKCLDKRIKSEKKYIKNHPDRIKESNSKYRKNNREKLKILRRKHNESNRIYMSVYRKENKEKIVKTQKICRENKKDHYNEKKREYYKNSANSKVKGLEYSRRRRARIHNSEGNFTHKEFDDLVKFYGHRCLGCGRKDVKLEADHIIPISLGGSNSIENIQPLCRSCNAKKFKTIIDYRSNYGYKY